MQCEAPPVELKTGVSCNQNRKSTKTRKTRAKKTELQIIERKVRETCKRKKLKSEDKRSGN
jgi:hypothetical protein